MRPLDGASLGAATMGMRPSMEPVLQSGHGKCGHMGGGKDWVLALWAAVCVCASVAWRMGCWQGYVQPMIYIYCKVIYLFFT